MSLGLGFTPRRPRRCPAWNYWSDGAYFVTFVTARRRRCLSDIVRREVRLTPAGEGVLVALLDMPSHHSGVSLGEFVIMPDHVHLLLHLLRPSAPLPTIVNHLKARATREVRLIASPSSGRLWQPSFNDHIIRDPRHLRTVERYIRTNPRRWRG